jgi:hypothetical protein
MRVPRTMLFVAALAVVTGGVVGGCGSGGSSNASTTSSSVSSAQTLLREAFSGKHPVTSGNIQLSLELVPTGSSVLTAPVKIAFGGPFQSGGKGTLPESDFTVDASAQGHDGKLSIVSTGTAGYITVDGVSYQLPAASYSKLKSGFSSVSGSSSTSGSSILGRLGIDPLSWLTNPQVVGQATVGGVSTDHVTASVDVPGLLRDLNKLVSKASTLGVSGAGKLGTGLSSSEQSQIAAHIKSPTFDVWVGTGDKMLQKLTVGLTVPVTGTLTKSLGGLTSAQITLTLQYSDLNQPQTVTAPTDVQPYSQFQQKIASILQTVEGGLAAGELGQLGAAGSGTTGGVTTTPLSGVDKKYSECIVKAAGNVAKQQQCTALLGG